MRVAGVPDERVAFSFYNASAAANAAGGVRVVQCTFGQSGRLRISSAGTCSP